MKARQVSALLILLATSVVLIALIQIALVQANDQSTSSGKSTFKFSKLFNFNSFKKLFRKSYNSPSEQSNREKIFHGNLFRSFLSKISFETKKSTTYLSVNEMSDWTDEEFERTLMDPKVYYEDTDSYFKSESRTLGDLFSVEDVEKPDTDMDAKSIDYRLEELLNRLENGEHTTDESHDDKHMLSQISNKFSDFKKHLSKVKHMKLKLGEKLHLLGKIFSGGLDRAMNNLEGFIIRSIYKMPKHRTDLPDEVFVDHNKSGCLGRVKNQRGCGSCYIFSTMALYEWAFCRLNGEQVVFSEQYVVDCGGRLKLKGCRGGSEYWVASFTKKYGLELMTHIVYSGKETMCPYDTMKDKDNKSGEATKKKLFEELELPAEVGEDAMGKFKMQSPKLVEVSGPSAIEKQLKISPVIIAFRTSGNFRHYGGGVDLGKGCEKKHTLHSMLIVGSGRQDGYEYWLVRNSHGASWGENGHWKLAKNNNCYTFGNLGMTIKALDYHKAPKLIADSTVPLIELERESKKNVVVYNFTENPKHDIRFLYYSVTRIMHKSANLYI